MTVVPDQIKARAAKVPGKKKRKTKTETETKKKKRKAIRRDLKLGTEGESDSSGRAT